MKRSGKIIIVGLFLVVGLIGYSEGAEAMGKNIQVPSYTLKDYLNRRLTIDYIPEEDQDIEKDKSYGGVPEYLFNQDFDVFEPRLTGYESSSLEGLQQVRTKKLVLQGQPYDLNPITNIYELEELDLKIVSGQGYGGRARTGSSDLSFMKDGFPNLKVLTYTLNGSYDGINALLDVSELSEHPNLERVTIKSEGGLQPASMKKGYRKYELFDPVILSDQFAGADITYSSTDATFSNVGNLLKWTTIPEKTEYLNLSWLVEKGDFRFEGDVQIPIDWK